MRTAKPSENQHITHNVLLSVTNVTIVTRKKKKHSKPKKNPKTDNFTYHCPFLPQKWEVMGVLYRRIIVKSRVGGIFAASFNPN